MATIDDDLAKSVTEAFRLSQLDILNQDKLLTGPDDVEIELASGQKVKGPSWPKISKLATDADPDSKQPKDHTLTNLSGKDVAGLLQYFGLSNVMNIGDFGLGIKNETKTGGMAALGVTKFDYFKPSDNIGPMPGKWFGGLSYAMGDDIGWQLAGLGQDLQGGKPRLLIRMKYQDKSFSQWGEIYHTLNRPTTDDLGLGTASLRNTGTSANQIPDMSSFTSGGNSKARWRKLPDGSIEQFGVVSDMSTNAVTVAFPIAFPSEMTSITVAPTGDLVANSYNAINIAGVPAQGGKLTHFTATGYNTYTDGRTSLNNVIFYWRAIGR
jgi:hypothetical protein